MTKENESTIVQHLVDLLRPIGDYRREHVKLSRGKHRKKRKREDAKEVLDSTESAEVDDNHNPRISDHLTIGFNSTVRSLEAMSRRSQPTALKDTSDDTQVADIDGSNLAVVFVCRSVLPDPITASIPLLIATASLAQPQSSPIRLVQLSAKVESKLAEALHQPRVGFVGLRRDTPGADVLMALVHDTVNPVRVPWLDGLENPHYLPVQIESTETSIGSKNKMNQTSKAPKQPQKVKSQARIPT